MQSRSRSKHNTHPSSPSSRVQAALARPATFAGSAPRTHLSRPRPCTSAISLPQSVVILSAALATRPTAHGPRPSDPLSPPRGQGYGKKFGSPVPMGTGHPYPLLAAQALSIAPDSKSRPCVDWCSAPDDRLTRRQAPQNPWDTYWGPQHTSIVLPPRGFEAQALEKMIADKSYGLIFLRTIVHTVCTSTRTH